MVYNKDLYLLGVFLRNNWINLGFNLVIFGFVKLLYCMLYCIYLLFDKFILIFLVDIFY